MIESIKDLATRLENTLGEKLCGCVIAFKQVTLEVRPADLEETCLILRDDPGFAFEQLSDLCGIDYASYGEADWQTNSASSTGFSRGVAPGVESAGATDPEKTGTDKRFAVIYHLLSIKHKCRVRVRCFAAGDPPQVPSLVDIWSSANWYEREAFDLFGIHFPGHPDLRRILTDYGFIGHPFRKDFPLEGNMEMRYDAEQRRVIYQPVTIKPRVLVPRVIRHDKQHRGDADGGES